MSQTTNFVAKKLSNIYSTEEESSEEEKHPGNYPLIFQLSNEIVLQHYDEQPESEEEYDENAAGELLAQLEEKYREEEEAEKFVASMSLIQPKKDQLVQAFENCLTNFYNQDSEFRLPPAVNHGKRWTTEMDKQLVASTKSEAFNLVESAKYFGRTETSIKLRCFLLASKDKDDNLWEHIDVEFIREYFSENEYNEFFIKEKEKELKSKFQASVREAKINQKKKQKEIEKENRRKEAEEKRKLKEKVRKEIEKSKSLKKRKLLVGDFVKYNAYEGIDIRGIVMVIPSTRYATIFPIEEYSNGRTQPFNAERKHLQVLERKQF
jgi:hypothetical protein